MSAHAHGLPPIAWPASQIPAQSVARARQVDRAPPSPPGRERHFGAAPSCAKQSVAKRSGVAVDAIPPPPRARSAQIDARRMPRRRGASTGAASALMRRSGGAATDDNPSSLLIVVGVIEYASGSSTGFGLGPLARRVVLVVLVVAVVRVGEAHLQNMVEMSTSGGGCGAQRMRTRSGGPRSDGRALYFA